MKTRKQLEAEKRNELFRANMRQRLGEWWYVAAEGRERMAENELQRIREVACTSQSESV